MQMRRLTIYGAIALATPLLVLANALLSSAEHTLRPSVVPLQPLLAHPPRLNATAQTLAMAYRAWMMHPEARIVAERGELFLEFYAPFNLLEHGPHLSLILVTTPSPIATGEPWSDRSLALGAMQPAAGLHRYPLPAIAASDRYQTVVIWCTELGQMIGYASLAS